MMNKKEIAELKRRITAEKSNIDKIYTYYINGAKEIISASEESVIMLTNEEKDSYFGILKKTLGGTLGKNLIPLNFETNVVMSSEEHKMLADIRKSELKDEELREELVRNIAVTVDMDGNNYVIVLAMDRYDVPHRHKDGFIDTEASDEVFRYIMCGICPVKTGKPELGYDADEKRFAYYSSGNVVCAPEIGFLYPAFDNRATNIYGALMFSKSTKINHQELIEKIFKAETPMAPAVQSEIFLSAINETISEAADYNTIQVLHEQISTVIESHKESKSPEQLTMSIEQIGNVLANCGVDNTSIEQFEARVASEFGDDAELIPANIINTKKMEIALPEVKISCNPLYANLIQTKLINGKKYIMISADSSVEVNGIPINIEK